MLHTHVCHPRGFSCFFYFTHQHVASLSQLLQHLLLFLFGDKECTRILSLISSPHSYYHQAMLLCYSHPSVRHLFHLHEQIRFQSMAFWEESRLRYRQILQQTDTTERLRYAALEQRTFSGLRLRSPMLHTHTRYSSSREYHRPCDMHANEIEKQHRQHLVHITCHFASRIRFAMQVCTVRRIHAQCCLWEGHGSCAWHWGSFTAECIFLHGKFPHGTHNVHKPELCCDCMFARFKASSSGVRLVAVVGACSRLM